jgi:hypothetical protein
MKNDLRIIYHYENAEGKKLQRTFWISEIKCGLDYAHLKLIPGYYFVGMEYYHE